MHKLLIRSSSIILTLLLILSLSVSHAASLTLTSIGALSTEGSMYAEWWYTGTNPTLSGTASAGATVKVNVDGNEQTTTADGSGSWSMGTTMSEGDHQITITSDGETYSFSLNIGSTMPDFGTTTTTTPQTTSSQPVPDTGSQQLLVLMVSTSLLALGYIYIRNGRKGALKAFEKDLTR